MIYEELLCGILILEVVDMGLVVVFRDNCCLRIGLPWIVKINVKRAPSACRLKLLPAVDPDNISLATGHAGLMSKYSQDPPNPCNGGLR